MDYNKLESQILSLLNRDAQNIVSETSLSSTRAIGDAVQEFLASDKGFITCLPPMVKDTFEEGETRRSMEDMAFTDEDGKYYAIDVKTHNKATFFNMPNLISVKRLANFYKNDSNHFCILIVEYTTGNGSIIYEQCHLKPIEAFDWECLTLGALGWGQVQIANANNLVFTDDSRKAWMLRLCDNIAQFYDEEIAKIHERKTWFSDIRHYWESK